MTPVHPRLRGELSQSLLRAFLLLRFIPAYAGNSSSAHIPLDMTPVHPRLRGELSQSLLRAFLLLRFIPAYAGNSMEKIRANMTKVGSSPLTRGTPYPRSFPIIAGRFIPAYAGNSGLRPAFLKSPTVHPRLRGELSFWFSYSSRPHGSSPLTRGTRIFKRNGRSTQRFIPAYAGNSRSFGRYSDFRSVHPRLRGELCFLICFSVGQRGSSPLTRGTPACKRSITLVKRFIPAYAGNSYSARQQNASDSVHPRLRGELGCSGGALSLLDGSSPLTRGTLPCPLATAI